MRNPRTFKITEGDDEIGLILRKGVVGDWKNNFTPETNRRFEKEVLAKQAMLLACLAIFVPPEFLKYASPHYKNL